MRCKSSRIRYAAGNRISVMKVAKLSLSVDAVQTLQCLHLVGCRLARLRHPTRLLEIVLSVKR